MEEGASSEEEGCQPEARKNRSKRAKRAAASAEEDGAGEGVGGFDWVASLMAQDAGGEGAGGGADAAVEGQFRDA